MKTKLFGQFLLEKGYVTREQLLKALAEQRRSTATLGDLAVATGMLTVQDVDAIYRRQHTLSEPFAAAAVNLGLLTEQQIADLLHPDSAERLLLGQILVAHGSLTESVLEEALSAHSRVPATDGTTVMRHFRGTDLDEVGPLCVQTMQEVFREMTGVGVSIDPIPAAKAVSVGQRVWGQVILQGPDRLELAVQLADGDIYPLAEAVLGMPVDGFDDLAQDAVSEFLNVVTGHVCAHLQAEGGTVTAQPPTVQPADEFAHQAEPGVAIYCTGDALSFTFMVGRPTVRPRPVGHWAVVAAAE